MLNAFRINYRDRKRKKEEEREKKLVLSPSCEQKIILSLHHLHLSLTYIFNCELAEMRH